MYSPRSDISVTSMHSGGLGKGKVEVTPKAFAKSPAGRDEAVQERPCTRSALDLAIPARVNAASKCMFMSALWSSTCRNATRGQCTNYKLDQLDKLDKSDQHMFRVRITSSKVSVSHVGAGRCRKAQRGEMQWHAGWLNACSAWRCRLVRIHQP